MDWTKGDREEMARLPKQCAWCQRRMNAFGNPMGEPIPVNYSWSHGCCKECKPGVIAEIEAAHRTRRKWRVA